MYLTLDKNFIGITTPGQRGPGSNTNKGVIPNCPRSPKLEPQDEEECD